MHGRIQRLLMGIFLPVLIGPVWPLMINFAEIILKEFGTNPGILISIEIFYLLIMIISFPICLPLSLLFSFIMEYFIMPRAKSIDIILIIGAVYGVLAGALIHSGLMYFHIISESHLKMALFSGFITGIIVSWNLWKDYNDEKQKH